MRLLPAGSLCDTHGQTPTVSVGFIRPIASAGQSFVVQSCYRGSSSAEIGEFHGRKIKESLLNGNPACRVRSPRLVRHKHDHIWAMGVRFCTHNVRKYGIRDGCRSAVHYCAHTWPMASTFPAGLHAMRTNCHGADSVGRRLR